jgi:helix-turn-helix protein
MTDFDPTALDDTARELLRHAAAMGGWVTVGYLADEYRHIGQDLVDQGLMAVVVKDRRDCYQLTDLGRDVAARISREG